MSSSQRSIPDRTSRVQLPGFGLPVQHLPLYSKGNPEKCQRFPHAIADYLASKGVTLRERRMLDFIDKISDKPEWERKVFDENIVSKYRAEACVYADDIGDEILSEQMFDYVSLSCLRWRKYSDHRTSVLQCIAELRDKAKTYQETGMVAVLDAETTVIKSDKAISPELKQSLVENVLPLEDVEDKHKDWHPGSNEMVLDLLHPSLFPLVYGLSKVLPHGTVPLQNCDSCTGMGEVTAAPSKYDPLVHSMIYSDFTTTLKAWGDYQWLPSNVNFTEAGEVKIDSYINNLHPEVHKGLYKVLQECVECSIPLWNECLSQFHSRMRIPAHLIGGSDEDYTIPEGLIYPRPPQEAGQSDAESESDSRELEDDEDYQEWKQANRVLVPVEPIPFLSVSESLKQNSEGVDPVDLRKNFAHTGLQVIFKLATIHLTPDKPEYSGGSWHVEGALNEHICATALYYYDQANVTESHLAFRQSVDTDEMIMKPMQV
jgi:hypothetical protein